MHRRQSIQKNKLSDPTDQPYAHLEGHTSTDKELRIFPYITNSNYQHSNIAQNLEYYLDYLDSKPMAISPFNTQKQTHAQTLNISKYKIPHLPPELKCLGIIIMSQHSTLGNHIKDVGNLCLNFTNISKK
jgi:hypothetical protein